MATVSNVQPKAPKSLVYTAIVSGLIAFVLLVLTPFLPVNQVQSKISWPQQGSVASVNAPLISLAPQDVSLTIPLSAVDELRDGQTTILSTLPESSKEATDRGLFITAPEGGLVVSSLNDVVFELTPDEVRSLPADARLEIRQTDEGMTAAIPGTTFVEESDDDYRPQLTGLYTELKPEASQKLIDAGLTATVDVNSRFTSSPTTVKLLSMVGGLVAALIGLWALRRLDRYDGKHLPAFGPRWRTFTLLDAVVLAILAFWHVFGANTSDDGFLLTMARVSNNSDYMANYYRWYGVPEAPFGSPFYDVLALLSKVTTASMWMRLPTLLAAVLTWWILSREILPRLGSVVADRKVAHWTAAFVFLAFWLPYNNGLRPEPIIALGVIATWAMFERSIASGRLAPAAWGTVTAAITLACGPTGLAAVGIFLVSLPAVFRIMNRRRHIAPGLAYVAVFLGAGLAVFVPIFKDQTLATVLESTSVRSQVGPALEWFSEWVRYGTLFQQSVDGAMSRRFPMFVFFFCLILISWAVARFGKVPGVAKDVTLRMLLIVGLSTFFLMFTPTKWTHHFGIYAGLAGVIAALGSVVLSQIAMRSPRARTFSIASVIFLLAISLAGWNAWWYVSSFGIPWWDRTVQLKAIEANTVVLALGLIVVAIGIYQSLIHSFRKKKAEEAGTLAQFEEESAAKVSRWAGVMSAPLAVACIAIVGFSCASFAKGYVAQADSYSVGKGNLASLRGESCSLADATMVETNTNDSFLRPVKGEFKDSLVDSSEDHYGFGPNMIKEDIEPENLNSASVGAIANSSSGDSSSSNEQKDATATNATTDSGSDADSGSGSASEGTAQDSSKDSEVTDSSAGGVRGTLGINGSEMHLPFNLDYTKVPVMGSYSDAQRSTATITTQWYNLPEAGDNTPVLSVSAAGKIHHHDVNGVEQEGTELTLEYGTLKDGKVTDQGEAELSDVGATPKWRNLRIALDELPEEANVVRLVAVDDSTDENDWLAFTPPRVPELASINSQFDSETPALLDWSVALQFPCQRTFDHYAGVTEIPQYRILPDAAAQNSLTDFQSFSGGGAMATAEAVNYSYEIPSYLNNDWARDWGSIEKYELRTDSEGNAPAEAQIDHEVIQRSGLWKDSEMKIKREGEL